VATVATTRSRGINSTVTAVSSMAPRRRL
jgi:hypothetical protein